MAPRLVLLMRHAEKPLDPTNPDLSPDGQQRAAKLPAWVAQELGGKPDYIFAAAVSPHSRRPIETMEPLSRWSGISINSTIADQDYPALAADLLQQPIYDMKCVVICWHHGHIPSFAEDLGSNLDRAGRSVKVFKIDSDHKHPYFIPGADPGEGFLNTNIQLFSSENPEAGAKATNQGFVVNFEQAISYDQSHHYKDTIAGTKPADIMGMYAPDMLPIMSGLARGYAVCDRWFASVPTQTIPNRAFAAAATSQGHLDNHVKIFTCPSIFGRLSDKDIDWAIYGYRRDPLTRMDFPDTKHADEDHFGHFRDFQDRAAKGTLPAYTFLEPDFSSGGNSQHPNYDVALGEQLIHDVYYTLRNGPGWNDTLLLITYDEHGGNYDHVAPPTNATPPDSLVGEFDDFDFKRLGVRIPALLISPRIAPGTVFRAASGAIDHTSVLKTIEERWAVPALTKRDAAAPSLGDVLTLATPRKDDPLQGVIVPDSNSIHPNQEQPSELDRIHAARVAQLPVPNDRGTFDHIPPELSSSAQVSDYIRARTAAWKQHRSHRRALKLMTKPVQQ